MTTPTPPQPSRKIWRIVLIASLALNLAVAGAFIGSQFGPKDRKDTHKRSEFSIGPFGRALSKEDRKAVGEKIRADGSSRRETRNQMRDLAREVAIAVREDPFAEEKIRTLLDQQRGVTAQVHIRTQVVLIEHLEQMSPAERTEYAERLEAMLNR